MDEFEASFAIHSGDKFAGFDPCAPPGDWMGYPQGRRLHGLFCQPAGLLVVMRRERHLEPVLLEMDQHQDARYHP
jgi:hypothetical protein